MLGPVAPTMAVGNGLKPEWFSRDPAVVQAYKDRRRGVGGDGAPCGSVLAAVHPVAPERLVAGLVDVVAAGVAPRSPHVHE